MRDFPKRWDTGFDLASEKLIDCRLQSWSVNPLLDHSKHSISIDQVSRIGGWSVRAPQGVVPTPGSQIVHKKGLGAFNSRCHGRGQENPLVIGPWLRPAVLVGPHLAEVRTGVRVGWVGLDDIHVYEVDHVRVPEAGIEPLCGQGIELRHAAPVWPSGKPAEYEEDGSGFEHFR